MDRDYAARELRDALEAFRTDPCQEAVRWLVVALDSYRRFLPDATNAELLVPHGWAEIEAGLEDERQAA